MIAFLKGNFVRKTPALVHVDVNGVGYELHISLNTYSSISGKDHGQLHTYFHVREDAQILYGFYEEAEKEMFIQLLSVSGVGASTARMMLVVYETRRKLRKPSRRVTQNCSKASKASEKNLPNA